MKRLIAVILALCTAACAVCLGEEAAFPPEEWERLQADLMDDGDDPVPEAFRIAAKALPWFAPWPQEGFQTILLLSSDAPDMSRNYGRAGVALLCTVEMSTGKIRLLSLPEQAPVQLSGLPEPIWFKFVNCFGGPLLMMQTVSETLSLPVNRYFVVNLDAFVRALDRLGGVTLDLTEDEAEALMVPPGLQHLTGDQALRYVRFRWGDRPPRVRQLMDAVGRTLLSQFSFSECMVMLDFLLTAIDTNLTMDHLIAAVFAVLTPETRQPISFRSLSALDGDAGQTGRDYLYGAEEGAPE